MRLIQHVKFDYPERQVLKEAAIIGRARYAREVPDEEEARRLLNGIAGQGGPRADQDGEAISPERIDRALHLLIMMRADLIEESTEDYWITQAARDGVDVNADYGNAEDPMSMAFMVKTLIEARRQQLAEVATAYNILALARDLLAVGVAS